MSLLGIIALGLAVAALGSAVLGISGRAVLVLLTPWERAGFAVLVGMIAGCLVSLFALLAGLALSGWWWAILGGVGFIMSVFRWRDLSVLAVPLTARCTRIESMISAAMALMFVWSAIIVLTLPPMDYDSLAIWGHRLQVLLEERTLNTGSLRDPMRFIAQPLHPYFVPVLEASFCLIAGGYAAAARNAPYLLAYGCYLVMVVGASRRIDRPWRRLSLMAAAGLMPVLPTAPVLLSAREFLMAVFAFACVRAMILWVESGTTGAVVLASLFAVACQQVKIEGLPFAVGFLMGVTFWVAAGGTGWRQGAVCLASAATVFVVAVPWSLARRAIPAVNTEGLVKGFDVNLAFNARHLGDATVVLLSEIFARPELYGLAGLALLAGLATGWRRSSWRMRLTILLPPMILLAAIFANLSARVGEGPERLYSLPRRTMILLPCFLLASLYVFPAPRRAADSKTTLVTT
jgi:hypothetical protein